MKYLHLFLAIYAVIFSFQCSEPLENDNLEKETFSIMGDQDNIIESAAGSVLVIPQGALVDSDGNTVSGKIDIEYYEGFEPGDMMEANASMNIEGGVLESEVIFQMEATSNGEKLTIDQNSAVYIEPAIEQISDEYQLYKGERKDGQLTWSTPEEPTKYLTTVDLETLDFYPEGYETEVEKGMPFRSHQIASKELKDSLFYTLGFGLIEKKELFFSISYSQNVGLEDQDTSFVRYDTIETACGIEPRSIKVLKSKKFQNTFIATREFASRLKALYRACDIDVLGFYVRNLNKNLWEIDEMVASHLGPSHPEYNVFKAFANEKLTNIQDAPKQAQKLKEYYAKQLAKVEKELKKQKNDYIEEIKKQNKAAQKKHEQHKSLLKKRERYRMNKFGFELKQTGWYNVAKKLAIDDLDTFELQVSLENGNKYDRVHCYIFNPNIRSLFALTSKDQLTFDEGYTDDPNLLLKKSQNAHVVAIGYKDGQPYWSTQSFIVQKVNNLHLSLQPVTEEVLRKNLSAFKGKGRKNDIKVDLAYQAFVEKDKKRIKKYHDEMTFLLKLNSLVSCCDSDTMSTDSTE